MALRLAFNSPPSVIPSNGLSPSLSCAAGRFFTRPCVDGRTAEMAREAPDADEEGLRVSRVLLCEEPNNDNKEKYSKSKCSLVKLRSKRPARLVVPEITDDGGCGYGYGEGDHQFCEVKNRKVESEEYEVRGRGFNVASKKGRRREFTEDGYGVLLDIMGDPKQAFFVVIDGHGGLAATDYVAKNLGKNIAKKLNYVIENKNDDRPLEEAIREGYLDTDKGFLNQGVNSGACAASVLVKSGHLYAANVGDCRVVICRNGVARSLTNDHRLTREDERLRIENSGGFVHCYKNGVWRVQGSLAVSRAIGDQHLKKWVISEPEINSLPLTMDCQFLIIASDGLWDKVSDQEAVDVVVEEMIRDNNKISEEVNNEACKKLVDMSSSRGNMDDITVMLVNLEGFLDHIYSIS